MDIPDTKKVKTEADRLYPLNKTGVYEVGIRFHTKETNKAFIDGAEWMEQQLEPVITELEMNEIKLKEKIATLQPKWSMDLPERCGASYTICLYDNGEIRRMNEYSSERPKSKLVGYFVLPDKP